VVESRYNSGIEKSDEDPPARGTGVPTKIRTKYLSNASQWRYCYANRLGHCSYRVSSCSDSQQVPTMLITHEIHFHVYKSRKN
jgi:hypothetical protein